MKIDILNGSKKLSKLLSFFTVVENAKIKLKKYNTQAGKEESIKIDFMSCRFTSRFISGAATSLASLF
ncbi:hypothetical protein ACWKWW_12660 [Chryseobacterium cucumeris]